jgi:hypothetical protein
VRAERSIGHKLPGGSVRSARAPCLALAGGDRSAFAERKARLINTHGNVIAELPHGYGTKLWLLSRSAAKLVDGR